MQVSCSSFLHRRLAARVPARQNRSASSPYITNRVSKPRNRSDTSVSTTRNTAQKASARRTPVSALTNVRLCRLLRRLRRRDGGQTVGSRRGHLEDSAGCPRSLCCVTTTVETLGPTARVAAPLASPGAVKYVAITPVTLTANHAYYIASAETSGGDQFYNDDETITVTSAAPVTHSMYHSGACNGTFTQGGGGGNAFGPVSLQYTISSDLRWVTGQTLGTLRSNVSGCLGVKFTVGASDLTVTQLGRWVSIDDPANTQTHTVTLYDNSGVPVTNGSGTVATTGTAADGFVYAALSPNVTLTAGATYELVAAEASGGDNFYNDNTTVTVTSAAAPSTTSSVYHSGTACSGTVTFTANSASPATYGPVDFKYQTAAGGGARRRQGSVQ